MCKNEALVNFLTDPQDGRSTFRSANVMVYGWIGGKHACVDLTEVSTLVGLGTEVITMGQTTLKPLQTKWSNMRKHLSITNILLYHLRLTFWLPSTRNG